MEYIKNNLSVNTNENLPEILCEQNIDTDFTLPDYYPEINKILKCLTEVNILSKRIKDNNVELGGSAVVKLLYTDKNNNINSFVHTYPFNKSVELKNCSCEDDDSSIMVNLRSEFLNSKATAPRKVEVHGSITLGVLVSHIIKNTLVSDAENDKIFLKKSWAVCSEPKCYLKKAVFIEDELSIESGAAPIEKIIRNCQRVKVIESKVMAGKAVVKSLLEVELVYLASGNIKPIILRHSHPFSQIIDCDVCEESTELITKAKAVSLELHPKTSLDGEIKTVNFESKVIIEICGYEQREIEYVCDAFTGYTTSETNVSDVKLLCLNESINENYVCKKTLDYTDDNIEEILDAYCKNKIDYYTVDKGELLIKGTISVNILAVNKAGEPFFVERPIDYEYRYDLGEDKKYNCEPEVSVAAINYSLNEDGCVEVQVELKIEVYVFSIVEISALTSLNVKDDTEIKCDDAAITLYFASGETVWQIAKKYNSSPDKVCKINSVSDYDEICNKMMLIPNN